MKAVSLREQTDEELRHLHGETVKELFGLRAKKKTGDSSEQPLRVRSVRRELARIKTVMKERGVAEHG